MKKESISIYTSGARVVLLMTAIFALFASGIFIFTFYLILTSSRDAVGLIVIGISTVGMIYLSIHCCLMACFGGKIIIDYKKGKIIFRSVKFNMVVFFKSFLFDEIDSFAGAATKHKNRWKIAVNTKIRSKPYIILGYVGFSPKEGAKKISEIVQWLNGLIDTNRS